MFLFVFPKVLITLFITEDQKYYIAGFQTEERVSVASSNLWQSNGFNNLGEPKGIMQQCSKLREKKKDISLSTDSRKSKTWKKHKG